MSDEYIKKDINKYVVLEYNKDVVIIENKNGAAGDERMIVAILHKTFAKIAKELGYSLKRSSKSL